MMHRRTTTTNTDFTRSIVATMSGSFLPLPSLYLGPRSHSGLMKDTIQMSPGIFVFEDPPRHAMCRRIVRRLFAPKRPLALQPLLDRTALRRGPFSLKCGGDISIRRQLGTQEVANPLASALLCRRPTEFPCCGPVFTIREPDPTLQSTAGHVSSNVRASIRTVFHMMA
jgi:hypothetical protein